MQQPFNLDVEVDEGKYRNENLFSRYATLFLFEIFFASSMFPVSHFRQKMYEYLGTNKMQLNMSWDTYSIMNDQILVEAKNS